MNSYTGREYQLNTEYCQRKFNTAHDTRNQADTTLNIHLSDIGKKVVLTLVIIIAGFLFGGTSTQAQSMQNSDASAGAEVEYALIMGTYYYEHGRFEEAIEQFQLAIDGIPADLFIIAPEQTIVFWQLGEALEANGQLIDALYNYEQFLYLADESATEYSINYVNDLRVRLETINA